MLTGTVCLALSGAGLAVALLTAWRRRFLRATRIAAVALLPVGLYLTGLLTMLGRIGRAIGSWAAGLVLDPTVWAGVAVLALAVVLWVAARLAAGRAAGRRTRAEQPSVTGGSATALGGATPPPTATPSAKRPKRAADDPLSEFGDIEEILRKRGI
ncbi:MULTISPECIES: hypothetical protein [Streptomycetaceae]|nr:MULTISPECIES: hypothetical protein [Streptomycetaceae]MYS62079.1 hypothetical protein [Streptomyces sp. SID5468]CCB77972.1 conserved membrane protein of unknown function [Streptantibioticus cattleyicolor NRRL 8057 = DSM 46488]